MIQDQQAQNGYIPVHYGRGLDQITPEDPCYLKVHESWNLEKEDTVSLGCDISSDPAWPFDSSFLWPEMSLLFSREVGQPCPRGPGKKTCVWDLAWILWKSFSENC